MTAQPYEYPDLEVYGGVPLPRPHGYPSLLTVEEFLALGEDWDCELQEGVLMMANQDMTVAEYLALPPLPEGYRCELQEGHLMMSPKPRLKHNKAVLHLARRLEDQLPDGLVVGIDVDVDLAPGPDGSKSGEVRAPDIVIVSSDAEDRVEDENTILWASEILLAVEIVSPSSPKVDNKVKRTEYADAGIPHYWIVDLIPPVSMTVCHLAGEFGYQDRTETGQVSIDTPFPCTIDLDALLKRRS